MGFTKSLQHSRTSEPITVKIYVTPVREPTRARRGKEHHKQHQVSRTPMLPDDEIG